MRKKLPVLLAVFLFAALLGGCVSAPVAETVKTGEPPPSVSAPATGEAVPSKVKVEFLESPANAQAPASKSEAPPAPTIEDIQKKREMESSLRAAVDFFWGLAKQKNVDAAADAALSERREELKSEFYVFSGKYNISRWDVSEQVCNFGTVSDSEVSGYLMLFEKGSVTPQKKEFFQRWRFENGKWMLSSHRFK